MPNSKSAGGHRAPLVFVCRGCMRSGRPDVLMVRASGLSRAWQRSGEDPDI